MAPPAVGERGVKVITTSAKQASASDTIVTKTTIGTPSLVNVFPSVTSRKMCIPTNANATIMSATEYGLEMCKLSLEIEAEKVASAAACSIHIFLFSEYFSCQTQWLFASLLSFKSPGLALLLSSSTCPLASVIANTLSNATIAATIKGATFDYEVSPMAGTVALLAQLSINIDSIPVLKVKPSPFVLDLAIAASSSTGSGYISPIAMTQFYIPGEKRT
jgi:hypothetical protein